MPERPARSRPSLLATVNVYAPDGSGTATTTTNVSASSLTTITTTYTAATGGMNTGAVSMVIPSGWTAPQKTTTTTAGYTSATANAVAVPAANIAVTGTGPWTITISGITLAAAQNLVIKYGDTAGGVDPAAAATATATTGSTTWQLAENSVTNAGLVNLTGGSPSTTVNAANGTGTFTSNISNVSASSTGNTLALTYTAVTGGLGGGSVRS